MGFVIFILGVLVILAAGGIVALFWAGYLASRENYLKVRRWPRNDQRPRKSATGLSRRAPRQRQGWR